MTDDTANDSHVDEPSRRDLPRAVWVLVGARAVNRLGAFTLPFLGVVLAEEADLATVGLLLALFGLATIPSRIGGGLLADRLGRVPTICLGLVGCAASQLVIVLSPGLAGAAVGVVALGLAFEVYEPPSQALVADLTDERTRPVAFGLLSAALAAAGAVAGLAATWLGSLDVCWLLVADAASCLSCAVVVLLVVRPALAGRDHVASERVASGDPAPGATDLPDAGARHTPVGPWRDPRLLAMLAAGTLFALLYMAMVMTLPLTLGARGLPPTQAGLLLTVSAVTVVAGQPLLRWRWLTSGSPFRAMTIGYAVLALGLAGTGLATGLVGFAAATVLWSVGDLLLLGHAWSIVSALAPPSARGRYLAAYGLSWGFATVVAPVLGTGLLTLGGPVLLWGTLALVALALAAVQPALRRVCERDVTPRRAARSARARHAADA